MKKLSLIILLVVFGKISHAQNIYCSVTVLPDDTTVCIGDTVYIQSVSNLVNGGQSFSFNNGQMPTGWTATGGTNFSAPCGPNPTNTPYYWAQTAGVTPQIVTASYDVSCGGYILFDMKFAIQSQPSPCEGPDLANEGVSLQYSTNGGANWFDINYYSPGGFVLPSNPGTSGNVLPAGSITPYTTWSSFTVPIPVAAQSTTTKFRWVQLASSSSVNDNWGLDNIVINSTGVPCGSTTDVMWNQNPLLNQDNFYYVAQQDTQFVCYVYDTTGVYHCQSIAVNIHVHPDAMNYNLVDTAYSQCPTFAPSVSITNIGGSIAPYTYNWSTNSTTNTTTLPTSGLEHDTLTYYVTINDWCNYERTDSVVLIVNKTLNIDTIFSGPATCEPIGYASAFVVGQNVTPLHGVYYTWTNASNTNGPTASVWSDIPSGWYYISVEDAVCTDEDSVFIDMLNPPTADFTASVTTGCSPLEVNFTNNSQNTSTYEWDFGNGTVLNVNDTTAQNQTFDQSSQVQLVAFASPLCSDTMIVNINIAVCGCTNPEATNYNPNAVLDDGSCILPFPTVEPANVFTPNGDGSNDVFFLTASNHKNLELFITNRWGHLMFEGSGLNPTWNGNNQSGKPANEGVYFYKYIITGVDDTKLEGEGFLTLTR